MKCKSLGIIYFFICLGKFQNFPDITVHLLTNKILSVRERGAVIQLEMSAYFIYASTNLVEYVSYFVCNYHVSVNEAAFKYRKLDLIFYIISQSLFCCHSQKSLFRLIFFLSYPFMNFQCHKYTQYRFIYCIHICALDIKKFSKNKICHFGDNIVPHL